MAKITMSTPAYPSVAASGVGWLSEEQMIEVDRVMIEDLHIELIQMMENAGRNLAQLVVDLYAPTTVAVMSGSGGNGGGGMVAARHLANRGVGVEVVLGKAAGNFQGVPAHQLDILNRMGVPIVDTPHVADVVVDALIGYSLKGAPRGRIAELISGVSHISPNVVSLDTPSGVNVTDGSMPGVSVTADATMTLALPKEGLRSSDAVGQLFLADISVPPTVYQAMGVAMAPDFGGGPLVRVN